MAGKHSPDTTRLGANHDSNPNRYAILDRDPNVLEDVDVGEEDWDVARPDVQDVLPQEEDLDGLVVGSDAMVEDWDDSEAGLDVMEEDLDVLHCSMIHHRRVRHHWAAGGRLNHLNPTALLKVYLKEHRK